MCVKANILDVTGHHSCLFNVDTTVSWETVVVVSQARAKELQRLPSLT